jgi:hypothetical protein
MFTFNLRGLTDYERFETVLCGRPSFDYAEVTGNR